MARTASAGIVSSSTPTTATGDARTNLDVYLKSKKGSSSHLFSSFGLLEQRQAALEQSPLPERYNSNLLSFPAQAVLKELRARDGQVDSHGVVHFMEQGSRVRWVERCTAAEWPLEVPPCAQHLDMGLFLASESKEVRGHLCGGHRGGVGSAAGLRPLPLGAQGPARGLQSGASELSFRRWRPSGNISASTPPWWPVLRRTTSPTSPASCSAPAACCQRKEASSSVALSRHFLRCALRPRERSRWEFWTSRPAGGMRKWLERPPLLPSGQKSLCRAPFEALLELDLSSEAATPALDRSMTPPWAKM